MSGKVRQLFKDQPYSVQAEIATVVEAQRGRALAIEVRPGEALRVAGHRRGLDALRVGEQVLVTFTGRGPVVLEHLWDSPGNLPEQDEGCLTLEARNSIRLICGESRVEIHRDGQIRINGRALDTSVADFVRLQAATIELG